MPRRTRMKGRRRFRRMKKSYWRGRKRNVGVMKPTKIRGLPSAFPPSILVKLRYNETVSLSAAHGVEQLMNLNSCFDPDRTGVGHQPYAFDQWSTFYNRYRVFGVKYAITFLNSDSTVIPQVGIMADNTTSSNAVDATFWERPNCKSTVLTVSSGGPAKKVFRGYIPLTKVYGISRTQLKTDDNYAAITTASPSEFAILHIVAQDIFLSANVNVNCKIDLLFYTQMYDYNEFTGS